MNALHAYLLEQGIGNAEFATRVHSSEATISRLRRGKQSPSFRLLARITEATNQRVTPNDFLKGENGTAAPNDQVQGASASDE